MTGNEFHTIDISRPYDDPKEVPKPRPENSMMKISYINHGHYRDVFIVGECSTDLKPILAFSYVVNYCASFSGICRR